MRRRGSVRVAPGHGSPVGQRHAQAAAVVRVRRHRLAIALPAGRALAHVRQARPAKVRGCLVTRAKRTAAKSQPGRVGGRPARPGRT